MFFFFFYLLKKTLLELCYLAGKGVAIDRTEHCLGFAILGENMAILNTETAHGRCYLLKIALPERCYLLKRALSGLCCLRKIALPGRCYLQAEDNSTDMVLLILHFIFSFRMTFISMDAELF